MSNSVALLRGLMEHGIIAELEMDGTLNTLDLIVGMEANGWTFTPPSTQAPESDGQHEGVDGKAQAAHILLNASSLDYKREAIESIARSWTLDDPFCMHLALQDANAWATLHLAEVVARGGDYAQEGL